MPFNHIALATRDIDATHRFYTEVMGFRLAEVVAAPTPGDTELGEDDEREARALLAASVPALETPPGVVFHEPLSTVGA